jgi:uncharacterized protein
MHRHVEFDPRRLDVAALAVAGGRLEGEWPQPALARLSQDALPGAAPAVRWAAQGALRKQAGGEPQIWLQLQAHTVLQMCCQRCLMPVSVPLDVDSKLRFVRGEALAEKLDEDSEEDVLALPATLDLQALVEDELILALPLVPRHEVCPQPLPMSSGEDALLGAPEAESAFAGLAQMLRDGRGRGKPS